MRSFQLSAIAALSVLTLFIAGCDSASHDRREDRKTQLGQELFFDTSLSEPKGQSCATCHQAGTAFTDPGKAVSAGAQPGIEGRRSTPSLLYMGFSPELHYDSADETFVGGMFWDGRASNFAEQAKFPLLSAREMNNPSKEALVQKIEEGEHAAAFREVFGDDIFSDTEKAFSAIAEAISSFELSDRFAPFSSKFDAYLEGKAILSDEEKRGFEVFNAPNKGNCAACHPSTAADGTPPLFTDFTYDNLGVPKNESSPFYSQPRSNNPDGTNFVDLGLALTTGRTEDLGKMKVPTLRNVAVTGPYFHNGVFADLETVVRFYNSRDLGGFAPPEVEENVNREELGNLGMSEQEEHDLIAFLRTLTDGYQTTTENK